MSCVERMELSVDQTEALADARPRVLVAAGAGSGKTRLLVAYFVRALVDEGVPVERLVAVTFTRKAAAELTARIRSALEDCGRPDVARSLDSAAIGTIHALCRRLIKERALEAGVDPAFTVLEAEAAELMKDEAGRRAWQQVLQRTDEAGLEVIARRRDALRREMVALYDQLRGMGVERPQVPMPPRSDLGKTRTVLMAAVHEALDAGGCVAHPGKALVADLERLEQCLRWIETPDRLADPREVLEATLQFFPSARTRTMEPHFRPVRTALTHHRCALAEDQLEPFVKTMNDLLVEFHQEYEARKRERGLLDFADLELRATALVNNDGDGSGPPPAPPVSRVLIDEFQDTNELQCGILDRLGASRMLMVGDERQSIYRFRGADVAVFRSREDELETVEAGSESGGLHRLDVNYRSRPEILDFLNRLFSQEGFFGARHSLLRRPDSGDRSPLDDQHPAVEILVAYRRRADGDGLVPSIQEAEAEVAADRIRRLIDDEGWSERDIVVLLPAQTNVQQYRRMLSSRGIQVYLVRGKGYYSQEEVADVTSLLRLLVNPHDDLALLSVLRSPLVGMSDDGLYLLGREGRRGRMSLWEMVRSGRSDSLDDIDRRSLVEFMRRFERLRRRVGRPGLARLIDDAVIACDYDICLLASPEGKRRFANVRKLMRMADDYESLRGPDTAGFVDLVRSMGDLSDTEGSAPILAEGEDVVRVMTVHQSKGLEFPVVVLAGLGSGIQSSSTGEVIVGDDGRVGVFLKGSKHKNREAHDLSWGPAVEILEENRAKDQEEDIRLLYVAMTRAQQRLLLVGATSVEGKLGACRMGRIVGALGLEHAPMEGESVALSGVDAVVGGVGPSAVEIGGPLQGGGGPASKWFPAEKPTAEPAEKMPAGVTGSTPSFPDTVPRSVMPRQISFSALAAYQQCPRMFYLERVLGLGDRLVERMEDEDSVPFGETILDDDECHAGRDVGLLVHALLERTVSEARPPSEETLRHLVDDWIEREGSRLAPGDQERAVALTRAFWVSPVAAPFAQAGAEREVDFFFEQGGTIVRGVMDLLRRGVESWHLVDYKTNALRGRSPAELAAAYDLQATVYCLAALRAGAPAVRLDFVFLEQPETPVTVRYNKDAAEQLEDELDNALEGLRKGEFAPTVGAVCSICGAAGVCAAMACP
ncbi:MAG: UvrD-helicase domain-containing protein [Actinobacteria bacterium]|jgi:ATP-dependent helicase/nuclease subunit A|nr:UvrD-helicase domain-containing protein [Actinomycetota bacterium]